MIYPWLNIICAMTYRDQAIGLYNQLPWPRLSKDMKRFKEFTTGNVVIMGYNTFKSMNHKQLSNRSNIVITKKDLKLLPEHNIELGYFDSVEDALLATEYPPYPMSVWIIGGSQVYQQCLPFANKLYLTIINQKFYGDRFFPEIDYKEWERESLEKVEGDEVPYQFEVWKRK